MPNDYGFLIGPEAQTSEDSAGLYGSIAKSVDDTMKSQARSAIYQAQGTDPVKYANALNYSRRLGLHPDTLLEQMPDIQRQEALDVRQSVVDTSPRVAQVMADPVMAKVAQNDVSNLKAIEDVLQANTSEVGFSDITEAVGAVDKALGVGAAVGKTIGSAPWRIAMSTNEILALGFGALDDASRGIESLTGLPRGGLFGDIRDWLLRANQPAEQIIKDYLSPPKELQGRLIDNPQYLIDPEWLTYNVGEAAISMVPVIAGAVASGGSTVVGGIIGGLMEGANQYAELLQEGVPSEKAAISAETFGVIVGALNKIGLDAVMAKTVANNLVKRVGKAIAAGGVEGLTEYAEEPFQALTGSIARGDDLDTTVENVLASLENVDVIPGAFLLGGGIKYKHTRREYQIAQVAEQEQQIIDALEKGVQSSELAQLDPLLFQEAMKVLGEGSQVQNIHIPAEAFIRVYGNNEAERDAALNQLGVTPEQLEVSVLSGGDVVITVGAYSAAVMALPDFAARFVNDRRLTADGYTRNEKATFDVEVQENMRRALEVAREEREVQDQYDQETKAIYNDILAMRRSVGLVSNSAATDAASVAAVLTNVARLSQGQYTPLQLWEQARLDIQRGRLEPGLEDVEQGDRSLYQFIGEKGMSNLFGAEEAQRIITEAQTRLDAGATPEEVFAEFGVFKGPEGKWRYEIDDSGARIGQASTESFLDNDQMGGGIAGVLWHDELYKALPGLRVVEADITRSYMTEGSYTGGNISARAGSAKEAKNIILHELQHAVQEMEDTERGGSKTMAFANSEAFKIIERIRGELAKPLSIEEYTRQAWGQEEVTPEVEEAYTEYVESTRKWDDKKERLAQEAAASEYYQRLAGEAEARAVQERMDMSMQERRANLPDYATRKDLIVRMLNQDPAVAGARTVSQAEEAARLWQEMGTESPYFKEWFGKSKVVDEQGKPLIVYHGTPEKAFEQFDPDKSGTGPITAHPIAKYGFFFSPSKSYASTYSGDAGQVMQTYLAMEKPRTVDMFGAEFQSMADKRGVAVDEKVRPFIEKIKSKGHDGLILTMGGKVYEYMVFAPTQIKSVSNSGTFDANDPRILNQQAIFQAIGSADTSLNQVAATFKNKAFQPGDKYLDIGGGKWDAGTQFLAGKGTENIVFDPYNRTAEHNDAIISRLRSGEKFPTVTVNNVLNVIAEKAVRENVVMQAAKAIDPEGTAYFLIYEGSRNEEGKVTTKGWQNNAPARAYVEEVGKHFEDVKTKGNLILAKGPKNTSEPAVWDIGPERQGRTLFQHQNDLVALHNLSAESLRFAAQLGGLPVPSIGITKAKTPFYGYGDITLIGTRGLADPAINPVFSFDAYSARFPDIEWPKVKMKDAERLTKKLAPFFRMLGESGSTQEIFDALVHRPNRDKAIEKLLSSSGGKTAFLASRGQTVEPIMRTIEQSAGFLDDQAFSELQGLDFIREHGSEEHKRVSAIVGAAIDRYTVSKRKNLAESLRSLYRDRYFSKEDGLLDLYRQSDILRDIRNRGKQEVDWYATREALDAKIDKEEFLAWAKEQINPLFGTPSIKVNGRKQPMTLSNVVEAITSGRVKSKEKTATFGPGQTKAAMSKRFQSMEELQAERDRIVSTEEERAQNEQVDNLLENYRSLVMPYFAQKNYQGGIDMWAGLDASMKALADAAKTGGGAKSMQTALTKNGFRGVNTEASARGVEAIQAIKNFVTDYFEAKPQRAVSLSEFPGAVIPSSTPADVRAILEQNGIQIEEFDSAIPQSRALAVDMLTQKLDAQNGRTLFQSAYHGSPYKFDKFTLDKIGSGEGAQAFGWGLYFAGKKEQAEWYRESLSGTQYELPDGTPFKPHTELESPNVRAALSRGGLEEALYRAEGLAEQGNKYGIRDLATLRGIQAKGGLSKSKGQLYEVQIPEDDEMLLWDKPLSEQPEMVRTALAGAVLQAKGVTYTLADYVDAKGINTFDGRGLYTSVISAALGSDQAASEYLNSLGIKGIKYLDGASRADGDGSYNYVVFDDNAVDIMRTFYQKAAAFYSPLGRAVDGMEFKIIPAKDLINRINKAPGIKAEELEDLGIMDWLEGIEGKVSKEQVMQFIADGGPQLEEVIKREGLTEGDIDQQKEDEWDRLADSYRDIAIQRLGEDADTEEIEDFAREAFEDWFEPADAEDTTKYSSYQLPGGQNYREVLVRIPKQSKTQSAYAKFVEGSGRPWKVFIAGQNEHAASFVTKEEAEEHLNTLGNSYIDSGYESQHWAEPNTLIHYRLNDRTDADGKKVLFIEEIQSDWHQAGRKKGYAITKVGGDAARLEELESELSELLNGRRTYELTEEAELQRANTLSFEIREEQARIQGERTSGVPNAPFKKSWHMLAFKRILREAVEQGYDRVAWTPGEMQAERYDLSKQVDNIAVMPNTDGTYDLGIEPVNGAVFYERNVTEDKLPDTVGKDLAEKMVVNSQRWREANKAYRDAMRSDANEEDLDALQAAKDSISMTFSGLDLKVGGEGMKGFYDKMLPSEIGKYIKKWGAKVGVTLLPGDEYQDTSDPTGDTRGQEMSEVWAFDITPEMRESVMSGQPMYAASDRGPMGTFQPGTKSGAPLISIFQTANESTFVHETAHYYAELIRAMAIKDKAPEPIKQLWSDMVDALGIEENFITVEQHEQFARNMEAYLLEGKAPSLKLRRIFARYSEWLKRLYMEIQNIFSTSGTEFNPELKPIFDRLFATDEEIKEAQAYYESQTPFFKVGEGLLDNERAQYDELRQKAKETAQDKRLRSLTDAWIKANGGRKKIRAEAVEEVKALPVYQAIEAAKAEGGINRDALDAEVGEEARKTINPAIARRDGKADPSILAAQYGYDSPVQMVEDMAGFLGFNAAVAARVEARVEEERQRISRGLSGTDVAADDAYHNDDQLSVLVAEYVIAQRLADNRVRRLDAEVVREVARKMIADEKVGFATQTQRFARLERKAAMAARNALKKGDMAKAAEYKKREMLNHAIFMESMDLKRTIPKAANRVKKSIQQTKGISPEAKAILRTIGIRFGLIPYKGNRDAATAYAAYVQEMAGEKMPSVIDWTREVQALGKEPVIDEFLYGSTSAPYKELTVTQFKAVAEAIKTIRHIDKSLRTVTLPDGTLITLEDLTDKMRAAVKGRGGKTPGRLSRDPNSITEFFRGFKAEHYKTATIIEELDNYEFGGLFYQILYRPIMVADSDLSSRWADTAPKLRALFEPVRRRLNERIAIFGESWPRSYLVSIALNTGNLGNLERVMAGLGLSEEQVGQVKWALTQEEWDFVKGVWAFIGQFKEEAFALEKRETGKEPKAVDPIMVETPFGTIDGGYFPVVYDPKLRNQRGEARDASKAVDTLFGGLPSGTAMTEHGHLSERAAAGTGERLSRDLSVISDHTMQVLRDLTHREAVINVAKIIKHEPIMALITDVVGRDKAKQLWPWIVSVAREGKDNVILGFAEKLVMSMRNKTTFFVQGYKVATTLLQAGGILQAQQYVEWKYIGRALNDLYGRGISSISFFDDKGWVINGIVQEVKDLSPFMRERLLNADRDIRDATKEFTTYDTFHTWFKKSGFRFATMMQFYVADVTAWRGAFLQHLEQNPGASEKDAANFADYVVEQAMGTGHTRGLAKIQRGGSIQRLMTMFYSFGNVLFNLAARRAGITQQHLQSGNYGKAALGAMAFITFQWLLPAVYEAVARGELGGDGDDDKVVEDFLENLLTYPFQAMLVARELAGTAKGFTANFTQADKPLELVGRFFQQVGKAVEKGDPAGLVKPSIQAVGITTGYIPAQFIRSGEVLTEYLIDNKDLTLKELLHGKEFRKK